MPSQQPSALRFDALRLRVSALDVLKQSVRNKEGKTNVAAGTLLVVVYLIVLVIVVIAALNGASYTPIFFTIAFPALFLSLWFFQEYMRTKRRLRLQAFAADNQFEFFPTALTADQSGAVFSFGDSQSYQDVVSGTYASLPFEFGNFSYVTGFGKRKTTHWYGVLRITMSRRLPQILLDGKYNNHLHISNFPNFKNNQKLQLEGDFNTYFDLYVPKDYERDALYFMTPELMAILIDHGAKFDIEVVDNYVYIYSDRQFNLENEAALRAIFDLIPLIGSEFKENTDRYADANIGDRAANLVAEPGRRLKKTASWLTIIFTIVCLAYLAFSFVK